MADKYPPSAQRQPLLDLVKALGCRDNALRRDECGDWKITGRRGHIYAVPEGFQIIALSGSGRWWGAARRAIEPFARLTNDGDDEGAFILARLPSPEEAEIIRHYLAIPKKREMSESELERLASIRRPFEKRPRTEGDDQAEKTASEELDEDQGLDGPVEEKSTP